MLSGPRSGCAVHPLGAPASSDKYYAKNNGADFAFTGTLVAWGADQDLEALKADLKFLLAMPLQSVEERC